jgi:NADH-quinone oxidoreductase subunit A
VFEALVAVHPLILRSALAMLEYLPVLLFVAVGLGFGAVTIAASSLVVPQRSTPEKMSAYECGVDPVGDARGRFNVKFYMVAVLFIIFDIETVFMIPWGAYFRQLSCTVPLALNNCPAGQLSFFGLSEMIVFMLILLVGFVYVWKKGALQWD